MSNKELKTGNSASRKPAGNWLFLPVIFIIAVIPLIVRFHSYETKLSKYTWFVKEDTAQDFFLYFKSILFISASVILCAILAWKFVEGHYLKPNTISGKALQSKFKKFNYGLLPLAGYAVLALLSTLFSKYSYFGFHGIYEQFESIFVLLGYCVLVYYLFIFIHNENNVKFIFRWFIVGIFILCLIGFTQLIGHDFWASALGQKLMLPSAGTVEFAFSPKTVYATLYNPNYVGLYASLLLPVTIILTILCKSIRYKIIYGILSASILICAFGSYSRNALAAFLVSALFFLLLFRKTIITHWKLSLFIVFLAVIAFIGVDFSSGHAFTSKLSTIFQRGNKQNPLQEIQTNKDNVMIQYNNNKLYISYTLNEEGIPAITFEAPDPENPDKKITLDKSYNTETYVYTIEDERFRSMPVVFGQLENSIGFSINIDGTDWRFTNQTEDGTYYYYNASGKLDKIKSAEKALFANNQSFGSGRGYIWSITIPLLKKYPILGSGADTYALVVPQNDYVAAYHNGFLDSILTKPHSLYLQMGVQTGVLSLLCFLLFYGIYFISSLRLYWKQDYSSFMQQAGVAIFIGTIGYMVSSITNDSTITVAPIFWALIGIGMAINYYLKKQTSFAEEAK